MGKIQSSIGLITGLPIQDTVDQLISVSARPRDQLIKRAQGVQAEQVAVTELTAAVLGVQFASDRLGETDLFDAQSVTSTNNALLNARLTDDAPVGDYQFTPIRRAQAHQLLSSGFSSLTDPVGSTGKLSLRFGGFVDDSISLNVLNDGQGVQRGKIRITDRSGASAEVELRYAQTVDDVVNAINATSDINVTAVAEGDSFRLDDNTGLTTSNLKVQEVGSSSTANDLGLANVDVAADSVTGSDVLSLHNKTELSKLNDGNGISFLDLLPDLDVTFQDGSAPLLINFHVPSTPEGNATATTTAANGVNASIAFTATAVGGDYDDVTIKFIDDNSVTQGNETVVYDDSDLNNRTLTFNVEAGVTTATDVIAALTNDVTAGAIFTAANADGGNGSGFVNLADTAVTAGGAATNESKERTLGDLLETINAADPARLLAEIAPDGDHIKLTDLTTDNGGTFTVSSALGGSVAEDLGLTGTAVGGVITSSRLQSGLKTSLLSSLSGGAGLGDLGVLSLTDRSGATDNVDLSAAETLHDVVTSINAAAVGITASVNEARNGLLLTDTTGASASNLIVANGDATNTADALKIAVDDAVTSINSKSLGRQTVSEQSLLADLNGGRGVEDGQFIVIDSNGLAGTITIGFGVDTVGDVIEAINNLSAEVEARINDSGDGILLIDKAGGDGTLTVREVGSGETGANLHLTGTSTTVTLNGNPTQVIDGTSTLTIDILDTDSLEDVIAKINDLSPDISASSFSDGSGATPHHISLFSRVFGKSGELLLDTSEADFSFEEIAQAQDALLLFGSPDSVSAGVLTSSSDNVFRNVLSGVDLSLRGASTSSVTIRVSVSNDSLTSGINLFVDQYNSLRDKLDQLTFFSEVDKTTGILFGSSETLRVDTELSSLLSGRFFGAGSIQGIAELGLNLDKEGKLSFDATKLGDRLAANRDDVQEFFTNADRGLSAKLNALVETLAGEGSSLLVNRAKALQSKVDLHTERIIFQSARLQRQRDQLLKQFYNMELAIGKLQNNLTAIGSLQALPPLSIRG